MEAAMYGLQDWTQDLIQHGVDVNKRNLVRTFWCLYNPYLNSMCMYHIIHRQHVTCRLLRTLH